MEILYLGCMTVVSLELALHLEIQLLQKQWVVVFFSSSFPMH